MKTDIRNEADIKLMVDTFYEKVNKNIALSEVFNGFAKVNWESHLPKMYAFWNKVLFAKGDYKGNPFDAHIPLPVDKSHFEQWLSIFTQNIDQHFEGPVSEDTKMRAQSIAYVFQSKLEFIHQKQTK